MLVVKCCNGGSVESKGVELLSLQGVISKLHATGELRVRNRTEENSEVCRPTD